MSILNIDSRSHLQKRVFLDGSVGIARYDRVKYPFFSGLTEKQWGYFWKPEEFNLSRDSKDFKTLTPHQQHLFTSNLKRQIVLDTVQGRAPLAAFGSITSLPEVEAWLTTWTFFETIHSKSYTHVIQNVYSDPSVVFDGITDIPEVMSCASELTRYYDDLIEFNNQVAVNGYEKGVDDVYTEFEHKVAIWRALNSVNVLEGIRFYVSFACSWAFAELKKMEGNAKVIKFICRDENLHLASTQQLLKILPREDPDFAQIRALCAEEVKQMFLLAAQQERDWAGYLFRDGSMIGLTEPLLCSYVDWITDKRMRAVGVESPFKRADNPLPWTQTWISGVDVQVAPQETEVEQYEVSAVKNDVDEHTFAGFSL